MLHAIMGLGDEIINCVGFCLESKRWASHFSSPDELLMWCFALRFAGELKLVLRSRSFVVLWPDPRPATLQKPRL